MRFQAYTQAPKTLKLLKLNSVLIRENSPFTFLSINRNSKWL